MSRGVKGTPRDLRGGLGLISTLVLDRRRALAAFYGVGMLLCLVPLVLPGWPGVNAAPVAAIAVIAGLVTAALLIAPGLPLGVTHVLLGLGTVLIGGLVLEVGGGAASATCSLLFGWVALYAALFLSPRAIVAHVTLTLAGAVLALVALGERDQAAVQALVLAGVSGASAAVVFLLMRQVRAAGERDAMTGLPDRRGLADLVARRGLLDGGERATAIVIDLDRFHAVNVSLGHECGDELLRGVADALRVGAPMGAIVARLGADQFAVLARLEAHRRDGDLDTAAEHGRALAVGLLAAVRGPFTIAGISVEVEARAGIALAPEHGLSVDALLRCAEEATFAATVSIDRAAVGLLRLTGSQGVQGDLGLLAELRSAVGDGQLVLHYQPLVRPLAQRGKRAVVGAEALVRWQHPVRGLLAPGAFLPQAEPTGLIVSLTEWVLGEALRQAAAWRSAGLELGISVNLSARLLMHPGLAELIAEQLAAHAFPPGALTLEVTESAVMDVPERAQAVLEELARLGVLLSIDDFGTGYTSLALLARLPVHELKIDRTFVAGAVDDPKARAVVRSVLELGHRLDLSVTAEGVEDAATASLLTEIGVDVLQGYHLGRPAAAALLASGSALELLDGDGARRAARAVETLGV
jgi:diguanylate cyclase